MCSASTSTSCCGTRLRLVALFFAVLVVSKAGAQEDSIGLRPADAASIRVRARSAASIMLEVANRSGADRQFILQALLPEGWRALTPRTGVSIAGGATDLRLASFFVPSQAPAGDYTVRYRLAEAEGRAAAAECEFTVSVEAERSVELRILEMPSFVVAGDSYEILCALSNTGNEEILVELRVEGGTDYQYDFKGLTGDGHARLPVGANSQFSIVVPTSRSQTRFASHRATVKAMLVAQALFQERRVEPLAMVSYQVDVIPQSLDNRQIIHTVPFDFLSSAETKLAELFEGHLAETVTAKGSLDEYGEHQIDLYLHKRLEYGADPWHNSDQDRYSLKYRSRLGDLVLGDDSYGLSPLLSGNFGRGAEAMVNLLPFRFGINYHKNIWEVEGRQGIGGTADFAWPAARSIDDYVYRAALNVLSPLDGSVTYGLYQRIKPSPSIEGEADFSLRQDPSGALAPALYVSTKGGWKILSWYGRFIRAWPGFEGSFDDNQVLHSVIGAKLLGGALTLNAGFYLDDKNLELDESLPTASRSTQYTLSAGYTIPGLGTKLDLAYEHWRRMDRLSPPEYDRRSNLLKLDARQVFDPFTGSLSSRLEFGTDATDGGSFLSHDSSVSLEYKPSDIWRLSGALRFAGQMDEDWESSNSVGVALDARYANKGLSLGGNFSDICTFTREGLAQNQLDLTAKLTRTFLNRHTLSVMADLALTEAAGLWTQSYLVSLSYRIPVDIPVSRKRGTSIVRGRVYDVTMGTAMPGVLVRLNGLVVVSNAKGEYTFYLPRMDSTYLQIDRSTVPANMVSMVTLPMEVDTKDSTAQTIDIGMVESCSLTGSVGLYELEEGAGRFQRADVPTEASHVRERGLAGLVVELSDGKEAKRKLTNQEGAFAFPDMRPGRYTLKIVGGEIPLYHTVTPSVLELKLGRGESRAVEIRVVQDRRAIRIVEFGGDLVLETPGASDESVVVQESAKTIPPPPSPQSSEQARPSAPQGPGPATETPRPMEPEPAVQPAPEEVEPPVELLEPLTLESPASPKESAEGKTEAMIQPPIPIAAPAPASTPEPVADAAAPEPVSEPPAEEPTVEPVIETVEAEMVPAPVAEAPTPTSAPELASEVPAPEAAAPAPALESSEPARTVGTAASEPLGEKVAPGPAADAPAADTPAAREAATTSAFRGAIKALVFEAHSEATAPRLAEERPDMDRLFGLVSSESEDDTSSTQTILKAQSIQAAIEALVLDMGLEATIPQLAAE